MLDKFLSCARNARHGITYLLRGRLVEDGDFAASLNALSEKLESKWSIELNTRFQKVIDEQQKVIDEQHKMLLQIGSHVALIEGLHKRTDEQSQRSESRLDFLQDLLRQHVLMMPSVADRLEKVLRRELLEGLLSEFQNNFDPFLGDTVEAVQQGLNAALVHYRQNFDGRIDLFIAQLPMGDLNKLHDNLADDNSKHLLAKLIAYRLLGLTKVRLRPVEEIELDRDFYVKLHEMISADSPPYRSGMFEVPCYDLHPMGLNFRCHTIPFAINVEFRNLQYANSHVKVGSGDWVLDCGACWGDTSLWFAEESGPSGRVFAFEFIPSSLDILQTNLKLNPNLSERIELITHPVDESSGNIIRCQDNGAASTFKVVQTEDPNASYVEAVTVSIDDWVDSRIPEKVDFIKMDIEGAELDALRGAIKTLKRFRPRLAIAIYHRPEDIYQIPDFLVSLNLGYRYYLKHPTAEGFETVLLAKAD